MNEVGQFRSALASSISSENKLTSVLFAGKKLGKGIKKNVGK